MIRASIALGALLLTGSAAAAAPVSITFINEGDWCCGVVGTGGVDIRSKIWEVEVNDVVDDDKFSGQIRLSGGPLVEVNATFDPVSGAPVQTFYRYASGWVTVDVEWTSLNGRQRHGTFSAPVVRTFHRFPEGVSSGLAIGVDEIDGTFAPRTDTYMDLGPGVFSDRLARHLGVRRVVPPGRHGYYQGLEEIEGHPLDSARPAYVDVNIVDINAVAIPEPGLSALVGLAVLAGARRRKSRTAVPGA